MRIAHRVLAFVVALAAAHAFDASAATVTWTNGASTTANWSSGTNWLGGAVPTSASSTSLIFSGTQAASAATVSNNDIVGNFVLAGGTVSLTGATNSTFAISGNPLDFTVAGGTATFLINPAGTKPVAQLNTNVIIDSTMLLISNFNSNSTFYNVNGVVSGTGMLALKSSGTGGYNNGNFGSGAGGLNSANSFSGGFWFQQGSLYTGSSTIASVIGMTGQNSMFGSAGSVILGTSGTNVTLRLTPTASGTTDRTLVVGGTTVTIYMAPINAGTTSFGMGAITGGTGANHTLAFSTSGGNTDVFSVAGVVSDNADGSTLALNIAGSGNGSLVLSNTANSFSGGVSTQGNTSGKVYEVSAPAFGNSGANSPLGRSGTITIGGTNGTAMLTWTGSANETTDKVVNLTNTLSGIAAIQNLGSGTLKLTSDMISTGVSAKNLNFYGTGTTEIAGRIVDNSGATATSIKKGSNGLLILSGSNTFTGTTDVNQGTLRFAANSLNNTSAIQFTSTGILQYASGNTQDVSGKIQMVNAASTTIDTNGNNVTFASSFGGTTSGAFYKTGLGSLTLTGSTTYTGTTTVSAGGLVLNGSLAVGSNLSVAAAAWLGGSGTAPGTVTVSGTLSPGNSPGVITLGSLVLTSTSVTAIEVASAGTRGTNYDGVSILNASGLTYGGTMSFAFGGSAIAPNTTLDIFSFTGTPSGGFDTLVSTGFYAGTWTNNNNGTFTLVKDSDTLTFSQSTGDVIVVPEPAVTLVGMAGLVASLALRRRRRTRAGMSDAP